MIPSIRFKENSDVLPKRLVINRAVGGDAHQADKDTEELHDVRVGDRVEAAKDCVEDCDGSTHEDGHGIADVQDDRQSGACAGKQRRWKARDEINYYFASIDKTQWLIVFEYKSNILKPDLTLHCKGWKFTRTSDYTNLE